MPGTFDYAKEAEDCLEAAEKARSDESRSFLLAMARVWSHLAESGEAPAGPVVEAGSAEVSARPAEERRIT